MNPMRTPLSSAFLLMLTLLGAACAPTVRPPVAPAPPTATTATAPSPRTATIAFYNAENLFDAQDDPAVNDQDFLPAGRMGWTDERYRTKLRNLAAVIAEIGSAEGPDILGLNETENRQVLNDLVAEPLLRDRHYQIAHFESPDPRGIDVALLYRPDRFVVTKQRSVPLTLPDTTMGTRNLLVVDGKLLGEPLTLLVAHWPSRRSGQKSVNRRLAVARQTRRVIDEQLRLDPQARILLMGDLNDSPTDSSLTSILRAGPNALTLKGGQLFNAFYDLQLQGKGTMHFRSRPDVFDQMVLSPGLTTGPGLRYVPNSAGIYAPDRLTNPQTKFPGESLGTYVGRKYIGGYSDHFAVYLKLTK